MKLHKTLFYILILFLPVQLGKHFWPDWTMVYGLRLDYLSPTLYFTDLLILGILVSWIAEKFINTVIPRSRVILSETKDLPTRFFTSFRMTKGKFFLFSFFIFLFIFCFFAQNQPAAFYKLAKIVEFLLLGFYVVKNSYLILNTKYLILIPVIYSSLLAIVQFLRQGSIGGVFYWLGERSFTSGTPGIAQTIWNGQLLLRPYATFPHPNVLAGFLVIGLILIIGQHNIRHAEIFSASIFRRILNQVQNDVSLVAILLGTVALFLTFSHIAWVVFILSLIVYFFVIPSEVEGSRPQPRFARFLHKKKIFFAAIFLFSIFYFLLSTFPIQSESITYRQDLNSAAIKMWQSSPLTGVGLNNFLVRLPEFYKSPGEIRWFQPAHNIFLMVLAETGLIGLICLIWLLVLIYKRLLDCSIVKLLIPLTAILVLGFFDHYFYTLQQGQLLVALVFGLAWSNSLQNGKISG